MEGVFIDQSSMNPRNRLSAAIATNNHCNMILHGSYFSPSIAFGKGLGLFGSRPLPPLHSSLPPSRQPPLLPLPSSKFATVPSPSKWTAAAAATATSVRSRKHKNKPRPSAGSPKEVRSPGTARSDPKLVEKAPVALKLEGEGEEGKEEEKFLGWSLYSISPPPSSLPLPRFSLTRPKATDYSNTVSCNVEAAGRGFRGGGVRGGDPGATDDLRRLLRL